MSSLLPLANEKVPCTIHHNTYHSPSQAKKMAPPNKTSESDDDDDVCVLIYRESQLRKAEAAAAAKRKDINCINPSVKKTQVRNKDGTSAVGRRSLKKKMPSSSLQTRSKVGRDGRRRRLCIAEGCPNQAQRKGFCCRHGAKRACDKEGCTNHAMGGGVCIRHGAKKKIRPICTSEGCTNQVVKGGLCTRHGAKRKLWERRSVRPIWWKDAMQ